MYEKAGKLNAILTKLSRFFDSFFDSDSSVRAKKWQYFLLSYVQKWSIKKIFMLYMNAAKFLSSNDRSPTHAKC